MKTTGTLILFTLGLLSTAAAQADIFGSGANQFAIEFVTIGDPDNPGDTSGEPYRAGKVEYAYRIGTYEVSEDMINKANALAGLDISHDGRGANKPATSISWFEAARFVNWLNTSTGNVTAYKFDLNGDFQLWNPGDDGYDAANRYRNSLARYVLPSSDEWFKAAYYDPNENLYFDFPTGSDSPPVPVASGTSSGTAIYGGQMEPADVTLAGGLSVYGTMGQGGNVWEWEETNCYLINDENAQRTLSRFAGGKLGCHRCSTDEFAKS